MIIGFVAVTVPNFAWSQTPPSSIADIFGPRPTNNTAAPTATAPAFVAPDPVTFRIRMELGDVDKAREWLEAGLDPNFQGDRMGGGLHIAAWNGNIPLMEVFLAHGARLDRANQHGEQPLQLAALQSQKAAVEWLLSKGAPVNVDARTGAWTPLHYAAFAGQQELVTTLLDKGANIDARAPNGSTPLMAAIYEGKSTVAEYLIRQGARRDLKNDWGDGALEWAMKYNQTDLARMIASPEEFAEAASKPRASWDSRRSQVTPPDLLKLMQEREQLIAKGISPNRIDQNIAALRARYAAQARGEAKLMTLDSLEVRPTAAQQRTGRDLSQVKRANLRRGSPAGNANR